MNKTTTTKTPTIEELIRKYVQLVVAANNETDRKTCIRLIHEADRVRQQMAQGEQVHPIVYG